MALQMLTTQLESANFVTLCCDTSNHGNLKILPIIVRFFSLNNGVQTKLIDVFQLEDETGETLFKKLESVWTKFNLHDKVMGLSADNCPTNFGGITRGGENNLFARMQKEFGKRLIGIGCIAHLIHKSIENACHKFQTFYDIEAKVVSIYNYFSKNTVRNTRLQRMNPEDADEEIKLLGYANTSFLGLQKCTLRIVENFEVLKQFFTTEEDSPIALQNFFEHPLAKLLLIFVHDECVQFEKTIRCIESSDITGYEAAKAIYSLVDQIRSRKEEGYISYNVQEELTNLIDAKKFPFNDTILVKISGRSQRVDVTVDEQYVMDMIKGFYV